MMNDSIQHIIEYIRSRCRRHMRFVRSKDGPVILLHHDVGQACLALRKEDTWCTYEAHERSWRGLEIDDKRYHNRSYSISYFHSPVLLLKSLPSGSRSFQFDLGKFSKSTVLMPLGKVAHEGIRFTELPPGILRKRGVLGPIVMSNRL